jgi:hypothetical protein
MTGSFPTRCQNRGISETNDELARRGFEAALNGDLALLREFLDPRFKMAGR